MVGSQSFYKVLLALLIITQSVSAQQLDFDVQEVRSSVKENAIIIDADFSSIDDLKNTVNAKENINVYLNQDIGQSTCSIHAIKSPEGESFSFPYYSIIVDISTSQTDEEIAAYIDHVNKIFSNNLLHRYKAKLFVLSTELREVTIGRSSSTTRHNLINTINTAQNIDHVRYELLKRHQYTNAKDEILLLTDGYSNIEDRNGNENMYQSDKEEFVTWMGNESQVTINIIHPSGESDTKFFKRLVDQSFNKEDDYFNNQLPSSLIDNQDLSVSNYAQLVIKPIPGSEVRSNLIGTEIEMSKGKYSRTIMTNLGSFPFFTSIDFKQNVTHLGFFVLAVLIIVLLIGTLLIIPIISVREFRNSYVHKYADVKIDGRIPRDPLAQREIECNDKVVKIGNRMMLLETWNYLRKQNQVDRVKEYKEFFDKEIYQSLFNQYNSKYSLIFWTWFGVLGALISWVVFNATSLYFDLDFKSFYTLLPNTIDLKNLLFGSLAISLGFYLAICLPLGLRYNIKHYWLRQVHLFIIALGVNLASYLAFAYLSTSTVSAYLYVSILFVLLAVFNVLIYAAPIWSSLHNIFSSLIKFIVIASFCVLVGRYFLGSTNYLFPQFLVIGGLMTAAAYFYYSVLGVPDQLYLQVLGANATNDTNFSLNSILTRNEQKYTIGKNPANDLYVKWMDLDMQNEHAEIVCKGRDFYIVSKQGNVFVNDQAVEKENKLAINDVITFGSKKMTELLITSDKGREYHDPSPPDGIENSDTQTDTSTVKKKIKIQLQK